ncbi:hypothetical protein M426DRAFT_73943 [Hypoxylon sp. CI-4A]|nr:hypothetical protein M426DRAFT_73943 [Hypoxylon sp. CI-4A]
MDKPADPSHSAQDKRIKSIISFCHDLQKEFPKKNDDRSLKNLIDEVENQINAIKSYRLKSPGSHRHTQLDSAGTDLWNWSVRANRQTGINGPPVRGRALALTRVFSFLILTLAQRDDHNTPGDLLRLEKLAIKASKPCIEEGELKFALMVLQKAADYNGLVQNLQASLSNEELDARKKLEAEYHTLRIVLAWKDNHIDVAEHLYEKVQGYKNTTDPVSAENLADSLFEIGKDLTEKKNFPLAVKWLERAYEFIDAPELAELSREAVELRLAISQALVRAYLHTDTTDGRQKAENHVGYIESEMGDKLVVLLLRLELLSSSPAEEFDSDAYSGVLRRMIRSIDISDSSFNLMVHHIYKLDARNPSAAHSVLDEFITSQVLHSQNSKWVERAVVLRTSLTTKNCDASETIDRLSIMFNSVEANVEDALSATAVLAVQTLIWKKVDESFRQGKLDFTEKWCHVAMHPALRNSGPANTAKIARKLISCALERNDLETATDVLRSMTESAQREPMTLYLAYKVALRSGDRESASECLKLISDISSNDPQFLYACCIDAQQTEDITCAIEALQHLIEHSEYSSSGVIHLPALLRVVIRLQTKLMKDYASSDAEHHSLVDNICQVFEGVVSAIDRDVRDAQGNKLFTIQELDWFCKNAYNLSLKNTQTWHLRQNIRLFRCCLSIMAKYPKDIPSQAADDLSLRAMFCHFLMASSRIALARCEDNKETQCQDYLEMRNHIKSFDQELERRLDSLDDAFKNDLRTKLATLLDDLSETLLKAKTCQDLVTFQAMADCILRAESMPGQVLYSTLRKVINHIFTLERFDNAKLAKYLRCLLKSTLASEPKYPLMVMEDISRLVKQCADSQKSIPFEEVEWFIATAFNHGVDLYGANDDESSKKWITHALTLAHYHQDGGDMERVLQERQISLKWGE